MFSGSMWTTDSWPFCVHISEADKIPVPKLDTPTRPGGEPASAGDTSPGLPNWVCELAALGALQILTDPAIEPQKPGFG